MKKTYIQPQMIVSEFQLEGLIAASLQMHQGEKVKTGQGEQLTNKHNSPWSTTNWE